VLCDFFVAVAQETIAGYFSFLGSSKNGKRCESVKEHQNFSYKFLGYLRQRPFINLGINIRCVEHRILRQTVKTAPHRMKLSQN
jgi:hypothetical protein